MSFAPLLTETLERRTSKVLELLTPDSAPVAELPFPMSPAFRDIYGHLLRVGVIPLILNRRQTLVLEKQYDWDNDGAKQLLEILKTKANPLFDGWDTAWDSLWGTYEPARGSNAAAAGRGNGGGANGRGGASGQGSGGLLHALTGMFRKGKANGKADDSAAPRRSQGDGEKQAMAGVREMVGEHALQNGYLPPRAEDVELLKDLVRVSPKSLDGAWRELTQIHTQEFRPANPKERARPGSLQEAITRWQYSLPQRLGELVALRAAADLEFCDAEFVRQYIRQSARSQEEGEKTLPYLALYQRSMPKVIR